jgi:hypothetical protein
MTVIATNLSGALANIQQIHDNSQALADPTAMLWQAQLEWMRQVTTLLTGAAPETVNQTATSTDESSAVAQLQAENAELQAKVEAGEKAISAFEQILHPADASPSSSEPPTIQPANPGV